MPASTLALGRKFTEGNRGQRVRMLLLYRPTMVRPSDDTMIERQSENESRFKRHYLGGRKAQYWYYQGNVWSQIRPSEYDLRGMWGPRHSWSVYITFTVLSVEPRLRTF